MFANALDDLHMLKLKAGWFTMIKYDIAVVAQKEKADGKSALRDELIEHGSQ